MVPGILSGGIIVFSTLITEMNVTILLYSARWKTIAVAIYERLVGDELHEHPGGGQQHREQRRQRRPQHQHRHHLRRLRPVQLLDEIRNRRDLGINSLIEPTVNPQGCTHPYCPDGGAPISGPGDGRRRHRRWRIDVRLRTGDGRNQDQEHSRDQVG